MSEARREKSPSEDIAERRQAINAYNRQSRAFNPEAPIDGKKGKVEHFTEIERRGLKLEALGLKNLTAVERQGAEKFAATASELLAEVATWPQNMYYCVGDGGAAWQKKKNQLLVLTDMVDNLALLLEGKISDESSLGEFKQAAITLWKDAEAAEEFKKSDKGGSTKKGSILASFSFETEIRQITQFIDLVKKDLG